MQSIVEHTSELGLADKLLILAYILGLGCLVLDRRFHKWVGTPKIFYFFVVWVWKWEIVSGEPRTPSATGNLPPLCGTVMWLCCGQLRDAKRELIMEGKNKGRHLTTGSLISINLINNKSYVLQSNKRCALHW